MKEIKRVELHCHSGMSGNATMYPGEIVRFLSEMGMPAFAITDESSIAAYPELEDVWATGRYSARPVYGMEMIVADGDDVFNVSVLIRNEAGKRALYKMISENESEAAKPVYELATLLQNRENLLIGSGTDSGRLYYLVYDKCSDDIVREEMAKYDYIEVLPYDYFKDANRKIVEMSEALGIPVVAVSDARYTDSIGRKALKIMKHWNNETEDIPDNHFWSTEELLAAFDYLPERVAKDIVIYNTCQIAAKCETVRIVPEEKNYPAIDGAAQKLRELCMNALEGKYQDCPEQARERVEWELAAIHNTGMESYILQIRELLDISGLRPCDISGRGTAVGSMVVYLLGISEIDPIKYNLAPETIFGIKANREIDIDVNVPNHRWQEVRQKLDRVTGIRRAVAGGMLNTVSATLAEAMIERYEQDEEYYYDEEIRNRLRWNISCNYTDRGMHPGGMVIFPNSCDYENIIPTVRIAGGNETTYFHPHSIDRSFIKYDLLKHESLEMLSELADRTGVSLEDVPTECPEVLKLFEPDENGQVCNCTDLPEFRSNFVKNMVEVLKPTGLEELAKIAALSHGTGCWLDNGERLVAENGISLSELIATRDDVFDYIISLGIDRTTAHEISEAVRKGIVARGKNSKWQSWKKQLLAAGAPEWYVWSCEQIRYLFPRAHCLSYMYMTMRLGWFKVHYPEEFQTVLKKHERL